MPHLFKVACYLEHIRRDRAAAGDTVYLKSRPDVPMTVTRATRYNSAANQVSMVSVSYLGPDLQLIRAEFHAEELSL
ncbi:MAG: hypothetical protein QM699_07630 [Amaricoccus sp.]|uniref:hypothetical protein n=1 Tax=Amaricoccus sp. TaxID=1872485 RepID=UPI0039E2E73D